MSRVSVDTLIKRSVDRLGAVHPSLKEYTIELIKRAYKEGINVQISSGYRSLEDQAYIYGQGRSDYLYKGKLYARPFDANGKKLKIVSNAKPGTSIHNYGLAIDYFLVSDDGLKSLWTVSKKWRRVAEIAKGMGAEWGGDWTWKDYPHLQWNRGLTIQQLARGDTPTFPPLIEEKKEPNGPPTWDGLAFTKGQIGRITILKPINLWKRVPYDKLAEIRVLNVGEVYRVYGFDDEKFGGQYDLGANCWVTKMEGYIKFETPSKAKRLEAEKYFNK
jgi:hypothetical protein